MLIGLGLMLLALHQLIELMTDYEDAPNLRMLLGAASTVPLVDVLLAAGLTWAANSNVAIVLLVTALCAQNVVPPNTAFALVLGANLGTAINPVLHATAPNDLVSKRLAVGNLFTAHAQFGEGLLPARSRRQPPSSAASWRNRGPPPRPIWRARFRRGAASACRGNRPYCDR